MESGFAYFDGAVCVVCDGRCLKYGGWLSVRRGKMSRREKEKERRGGREGSSSCNWPAYLDSTIFPDQNLFNESTGTERRHQ